MLLFVRRVRPAAAVWLAAPPLFVYGAFQAYRIAWFARLPEIPALLRQKGVPEVDAIPVQWGELLRAPADGDVDAVTRLVPRFAGRHQRDAENRAPLLEAARHRQLDAVNVLLDFCGSGVRARGSRRDCRGGAPARRCRQSAAAGMQGRAASD